MSSSNNNISIFIVARKTLHYVIVRVVSSSNNIISILIAAKEDLALGYCKGYFWYQQ